MITPFANGSQDKCWEKHNCSRCKKVDYDTHTIHCDIYDALLVAYFTDGEVTDEIAKRMGLPDGIPPYVWDCPEREV